MSFSASQIPFSPLGKTIKLTAAAVAPSPVQAPVEAGQTSAGQYRIVNSGTVVVFLGVGSTSALAAANAQVVTSSQQSIPLLPGACEVLRFTADAYFTGITGSGSADVFVTPGQGL